VTELGAIETFNATIKCQGNLRALQRTELILVAILLARISSGIEAVAIVEFWIVSGRTAVEAHNHFPERGNSRLTLNVLLSFAQFEREVTGERIRDKVTASKKKGMWMGGIVPLGYDHRDRQLHVNEAEAQQVQHILDQYLRLGSVFDLYDYLNANGYWSKQRVREKSSHRVANGRDRCIMAPIFEVKKETPDELHRSPFCFPGPNRHLLLLRCRRSSLRGTCDRSGKTTRYLSFRSR
jgi:hypothetical protein